MIAFEEFELDNGLRVIVHEDPSVQIAVMNILYDVGSRDENPQRTGFAHLFEHLMPLFAMVVDQARSSTSPASPRVPSFIKDSCAPNKCAHISMTYRIRA